MANYKDFDAMFAEMKQETIPFKAFGKVYHINKRIPASIVLELSRREKGGTLDNDFMLNAGLQIFGNDILNELCAHHDFTVDMLGEMIKWAFEAINGKVEDEGEELTEDDMGVIHSKN